MEYEEREIGRWRYKRLSAEITETGCSEFQPLPIFSSIETARAITSSIHGSSHPLLGRSSLSQRLDVSFFFSFFFLTTGEHVDDEGCIRIGSLNYRRADRARVDKLPTPTKEEKEKLNLSNLTFVLLVQCAYLRII